MTRTSVFLTNRQLEGLQAVHELTRVPIAVLIRDGVDLVLAQHGIKAQSTRRAKK